MAQASSSAEGAGLRVAQLQETLFALKLSLRGGRILRLWKEDRHPVH